jgi:hypothetical protein
MRDRLFSIEASEQRIRWRATRTAFGRKEFDEDGRVAGPGGGVGCEFGGDPGIFRENGAFGGADTNNLTGEGDAKCGGGNENGR